MDPNSTAEASKVENQKSTGPATIASFAEVKQRFKSALRSIVSEHKTYEVDEAALPAYAHANPLIDYIFWQRVKVAYEYALAHA